MALQALAVIASHAMQLEPPEPQVVRAGVVQVLPSQQPLGQLVMLQAPPVQTLFAQV